MPERGIQYRENEKKYTKNQFVFTFFFRSVLRFVDSCTACCGKQKYLLFSLLVRLLCNEIISKLFNQPRVSANNTSTTYKHDGCTLKKDTRFVTSAWWLRRITKDQELFWYLIGHVSWQANEALVVVVKQKPTKTEERALESEQQTASSFFYYSSICEKFVYVK